MRRGDVIKIRGIVREVYRGSKFKVEMCNDNWQPIRNNFRTTLSNKLRIKLIKIAKGDKVIIEASVYDMYHGRIVRRIR